MIGHPQTSSAAIGELALRAFQRDGYLVIRGLLSADACSEFAAFVRANLDPLVGPAEFEADVGYPGAPPSRDVEGGATPRRLLHAYARGPLGAWAVDAAIGERLQQLMGTDEVLLSQCHHNCVMTKHPGHSSVTSWHQDIRYWSFDRPELVSVWTALGAETADNGALRVIPGSHLLDLDRGRLDRDLFLRTELAANQNLLARAEVVQLGPGDVLFFHSRLLHAAGRNDTATVKLSLVFTYHAADNRPIPGTRSAAYPSVGFDLSRGQA